MDPLPVDEVLLHVRDALPTDGRVGELGLDVVCEAGIVVVRGPISTETRKAEICALVAEVLGADGVAAGRDVVHEVGAVAPRDVAEVGPLDQDHPAHQGLTGFAVVDRAFDPSGLEGLA